MMRLIDADLVTKIMKISLNRELSAGNIHKGGYEDTIMTLFIEFIDEAPTIDPVKHGKWEIKLDDYDCEYMKCSCCGIEFYNGDNDTIDTLHNFCPNCGADMRDE